MNSNAPAHRVSITPFENNCRGRAYRMANRLTCRNDVGKLTFDVVAANDGTISEINCLQLNRLGRTASAPIDKGAGIKLFSKIGDRVEKGQPLYRIHTYDQSELDLATTAARANCGYTTAARSVQPAE